MEASTGIEPVYTDLQFGDRGKKIKGLAVGLTADKSRTKQEVLDGPLRQDDDLPPELKRKLGMT
ncbi:MAG: hypothetical protein RLO38_02910 [Roseovarius confluentis]|jgi:hypothetical protein